MAGRIAGADFDHIAAAAPRSEDIIETLSGLGATLLFGRIAPGFRWALNRLGDAERGIGVEVLEPWQPERGDFLARFVAARGIAFHHITFKVPSLESAIIAARENGYAPVGVNTANPMWKEAFLHPRQAHGIVIQLAESPATRPPLARLLEWGRAWPPAHEQLDRLVGGPTGVWRPATAPWQGPAAVGGRVVLRTDDPADAIRLFRDLLGGIARDRRAPLELTWPAGGTVAIEAAAEARGVAHLEYGGAGPPQGPAAHLFHRVEG